MKTGEALFLCTSFYPDIAYETLKQSSIMGSRGYNDTTLEKNPYSVS
jgi:hypothetical protein